MIPQLSTGNGSARLSAEADSSTPGSFCAAQLTYTGMHPAALQASVLAALPKRLSADMTGTRSSGLPGDTPASADRDAISEVSTTSSERPQDQPESEMNAVQKWISIPSKRRTKAPRDVPVSNSPSSAASHVGRSDRKPVGDRGGRPVPAKAQEFRPGATMTHSKGKGEGKGKGLGLPHFRKINVGIDDDSRFRVVQRLIGPHGRNMQEITGKAKGAKIWIIGRGSRSWEDNTGPLVICVGATMLADFEAAMAQVRELLDRVTEEYRQFQASLAS